MSGEGAGRTPSPPPKTGSSFGARSPAYLVEESRRAPRNGGAVGPRQLVPVPTGKPPGGVGELHRTIGVMSLFGSSATSSASPAAALDDHSLNSLLRFVLRQPHG